MTCIYFKYLLTFLILCSSVLNSESIKKESYKVAVHNDDGKTPCNKWLEMPYGKYVSFVFSNDSKPTYISVAVTEYGQNYYGPDNISLFGEHPVSSCKDCCEQSPPEYEDEAKFVIRFGTNRPIVNLTVWASVWMDVTQELDAENADDIPMEFISMRNAKPISATNLTSDCATGSPQIGVIIIPSDLFDFYCTRTGSKKEIDYLAIASTINTGKIFFRVYMEKGGDWVKNGFIPDIPFGKVEQESLFDWITIIFVVSTTTVMNIFGSMKTMITMPAN